jgi:hypothetical protein
MVLDADGKLDIICGNYDYNTDRGNVWLFRGLLTRGAPHAPPKLRADDALAPLALLLGPGTGEPFGGLRASAKAESESFR